MRVTEKKELHISHCKQLMEAFHYNLIIAGICGFSPYNFKLGANWIKTKERKREKKVSNWNLAQIVA